MYIYSEAVQSHIWHFRGKLNIYEAELLHYIEVWHLMI